MRGCGGLLRIDFGHLGGDYVVAPYSTRTVRVPAPTEMCEPWLGIRARYFVHALLKTTDWCGLWGSDNFITLVIVSLVRRTRSPLNC